MSGANNQPFVLAAFGATGSGKSHSIKKLLRKMKPQRLIIWDPKREYGEFGKVVTKAGDLLRACMTTEGKPRARFKVVYQMAPVLRHDSDAFDKVCKLVYHLSRVFFVADELHQVTTAHYEPLWWRECVSTGRHEGLKLIGAGQRPARVGKSIISNATTIRGFRVNSAGDVKTMANELDIKPGDYRDLDMYQYWERDCVTGKTVKKKDPK